MTGGAGEDWLEGRSGDDVIIGGGENDRLDGGTGNDDLSGASGNDSLVGGAGADKLNGGSGIDLLWSGAGDDVLTGGGAGSDRFEFGANEGEDVVTDFDAHEDVLALLAGTGITGSSVSDADGDGFDDLILKLSTGGSITLLHVNDVASLTIETVSVLPSEVFA